MDRLGIKQLRAMLLHVADKIIENKPYLTEVDSKIGDGDHGIGMETGFIKVRSVLEAKEYGNVNDLFRDVGMAMLNSMGGASGVIFSSIFLGGIKGEPVLEELTPEIFARMMEKSLMLIKQRGKAEMGDKTMVDAFEPACLAMKEHSALFKDFNGMFASAEKAAEQGMEATKNYMARFGRAKSLLERAIGYQDAGATSVYLIFRAMREWADTQKGV